MNKKLLGILLLTVLLTPLAFVTPIYAQSLIGTIRVHPWKVAAGTPVLLYFFADFKTPAATIDIYWSTTGYATIVGDIKIKTMPTPAAGSSTVITIPKGAAVGAYYVKVHDGGPTVLVSNKIDVIAMPTIEIKPTEGIIDYPPTVVKIKGKDFPAGTVGKFFEIRFISPDGPLAGSGTIAAKGVLPEMTLTMPPALSYGSHPVLILIEKFPWVIPPYYNYTWGFHTSFFVKSSIMVTPPSVRADVAGHVITVFGKGFPAGAKIAKDTIKVSSTSIITGVKTVSATTHAEISIPAHGTFSASVTITDKLPMGIGDVTIAVAGFTWTYTDKFLASKPTIGLFEVKIDKTKGMVGDSISFIGVGFKEGSPIDLEFVGVTSALVRLSPAADANGALRTSFTVPPLPKGAYALHVVDTLAPYKKFLTTFEIIPKVTVAPPDRYVGETITITGTGFPFPFTVEKVAIGPVDIDIPDTPTTSIGHWTAPAPITIPHVSGGGKAVPVTLKGMLAGVAHTITGSVKVWPKVVEIFGCNSTAAAPVFTDPKANLGDLVRVIGTGYLAGETVSVPFILAGEVKAVAKITSGGTAGADGRLTVIFEVPLALLPATTYTVRVAGPTPTNKFDTSLMTRALGTGPKLFVNLKGDGSQVVHGYVGDSITLIGTGATPGTYTIKWDGVTVKTVTVGAKGNFLTTITVPVTARGSYTISYSRAVTFTVYAKTTVSPTEGFPGTPVTVTGKGFKAGDMVSVRFMGATVAMATADGKGTFTATFKIPTVAPGLYGIETVTIWTPHPKDKMVAFFTVTEVYLITVSATVSPIHLPGETAELYIATSVKGVLKTVEEVTVTLTDPAGVKIPLTPKLIAPGFYKATYTLPPGAKVGFYLITITASDLAGLTRAVTVTGFLVSKALTDLNARLIAVEGTVAIIKTDVGIIKADLKGLDARVIALDGRVVKITTDVGIIKADVTAIKADVAKVKTDVAGLVTELAKARGDIAGLSAAIYGAVVMALIAAVAAIASVVMIWRKVYIPAK